MSKLNTKSNIDYIEFIFSYNHNFLTNLFGKGVVIRNHYDIKKRYNNIHYIVEELYDIFILEPKGVVEGRIYIKLLNPILYSKDLAMVIHKLRDLTMALDIELIGLNKIDLALDLIDEDLFNDIDFNDIKNHKSGHINNKPVYLNAQINKEGGKSLYFNINDLEYQKQKKTYKKQRITGILYTKNIELNIKSNQKKKNYQNPDNKVITRLEIKIEKTSTISRESHLLKAMADFIWTNPDRFFNEKENLIKYIFKSYQNLYTLRTPNDDIIIDYKKLYNDDDEYNDFIYIGDFIDLWKKNTDDYNIKTNKYKKTYRKPIFKSKVYQALLQSIVGLNPIVDYKFYLTEDIILKIIDISGITNHNDLNNIKASNELTNGVDIFMNINKLIYSYIENNPIVDNYMVELYSIDDIFN